VFKKRKAKSSPSKIPDLQNEEIQAATVGLERQALTYQEKVKFWRRARWAKRDQDDLKAAIAQLRNGNNNLESIVRLLALADPSLPWPNSSHAKSLWPLVTQISKALGVLHKDLMLLNVKQDDQRPYNLCLRLSEDHQKSRRELEDYVSLQHSSFVFNLQRQIAEKAGEASNLMLVESFLQDHEQPQQHVLDAIPNLDTLDQPIPVQAFPGNEIERWGCFGKSAHGYLHILYHDKENDWSSTTNLADVLKGTEYREQITPVQVVQLAKILLCSHLYLCSTDSSSSKVPKPLNYVFFKTSAEDDTRWDSNDPHVLRPWLSFGFGRRPPRARLGGGSGVADFAASTMTELGLLLYQIGAGIALDYAVGATGLAKIKAEALSSIHVLDLRMGAVYAEIVENLLDFQARPSYLMAADDENQETEYVKKVISVLMRLEMDLVDTVTAPIDLPNAVPESSDYHSTRIG
jgi:hypothetical protein